MTNENLAQLIIKHDYTASSWVFNYYCSNCARFLYQDDLASGICKKCKTKTETPVGHPIPFTTSATALEKLIIWVRDFQGIRLGLDKALVMIQSEFQFWLSTTCQTCVYRQSIVDAVGSILESTSPQVLQL